MTALLAIDPGPVRSAYLVYGESWIGPGGIVPNEDLLANIRGGWYLDCDFIVIEKVESFGMAVGAEIFETVYWSGRFAEAAHPIPVDRIGRRAVKLHLCGQARAKDTNIRQALLDRFPGGKGTKRAPGPLHGISGDLWAALAVAVTYADTRLEEVV